MVTNLSLSKLSMFVRFDGTNVGFPNGKKNHVKGWFFKKTRQKASRKRVIFREMLGFSFFYYEL